MSPYIMFNERRLVASEFFFLNFILSIRIQTQLQQKNEFENEYGENRNKILREKRRKIIIRSRDSISFILSENKPNET